MHEKCEVNHQSHCLKSQRERHGGGTPFADLTNPCLRSTCQAARWPFTCVLSLLSIWGHVKEAMLCLSRKCPASCKSHLLLDFCWVHRTTFLRAANRLRGRVKLNWGQLKKKKKGGSFHVYRLFIVFQLCSKYFSLSKGWIKQCFTVREMSSKQVSADKGESVSIHLSGWHTGGSVGGITGVTALIRT